VPLERHTFHHSPRNRYQRAIDPLAAVYLANILIHETDLEPPPAEPLDQEYLATLKMDEHLAEWRAAAREIPMAVGGGQ
jgi:hypothetical protein